jgi:hypothetical protein
MRAVGICASITAKGAKVAATGKASKKSAPTEEFVGKFAEVWADPTPERLTAFLHPEGRLRQPMEPEIVGREAALKYWRRLFSLLPDLRMEVLSWAGRDDLVFIECRARATLGGGPLEWRFTDRIRLDDEGLVTERVAYFDSLPLVATVLRRPSAWPRWVELNLSRIRGGSS